MGSDELKPKHPKEVWIQWYGDGDPDIDGEPVRIDEDMCWCTEQVFDHDLGPYILDKDQQIADLKAELDGGLLRNQELREQNRKLREALAKYSDPLTLPTMSTHEAREALDQKEQP